MRNIFQSLGNLFQSADRSNRPVLDSLPRDLRRYIVERGGQRSGSMATAEDVANFLDACGIQQESQRWHAALAGAPVEVDDSTVRFIEVDQPDVSSVPTSWIVHAYPLQHVRIDLQGTRHSDRQAIIDQLETVLARLRAGDDVGSEHDDDFGYRFAVTAAASWSMFGDEEASRR